MEENNTQNQQHNNSTNDKSKDKEKKPTKKKKDGKIDKTTIIFFSLLVVGLIVITVIILVTLNKSRLFTKVYDDDVVITAELSNSGNINLNVAIDDHEMSQSGTFEPIKGMDNTYRATFYNLEDSTEETVTVVVDESELTIIYDDNSAVTLKETEKK